MPSLKSRRRASRWAPCWLSLVLWSASCLPLPGPVPLRDASHFRDYLSGHAAWQSWEENESFNQYWSFTKEGGFSAWIEDPASDGLAVLYPEVFPAKTVRVEGRWSLLLENERYQLNLTEMLTDSGDALPNAQIDLGWVDGKLRLEIGDVHFMTSPGMAPE